MYAHAPSSSSSFVVIVAVAINQMPPWWLCARRWGKVKGLGFWVGLNFFITLSVFPAVTADVQTYSFGSKPAMYVQPPA